MGYYKYDASASRVVGQEKWSGYYWLWLERNIRVGRSWHIGLKNCFKKSPLACLIACLLACTFAPLFGYTWPLFKILKMAGRRPKREGKGRRIHDSWKGKEPCRNFRHYIGRHLFSLFGITINGFYPLPLVLYT